MSDALHIYRGRPGRPRLLCGLHVGQPAQFMNVRYYDTRFYRRDNWCIRCVAMLTPLEQLKGIDL